jgi:ABC-2 type transport system permease protein
MTAGTGTLVRLALRRDRVFLPVALVSLVTFAAGSAAATVGLYPTEASRVTAAEAANTTPAIRAIYGPVHDPTSLGAIAMLKTTAFGALLVALVSALLVVRHTRAEEESGRLELMSAGVLGRDAPLTAALLVAVAADVVIAAVTTVAVVAAGLPWAGSAAFGLTWASAGVAFAAVAAVAVQLTERSRTATGIEALPGVHDVLVRGDRVTFDVDTVHLDDALRALTRLGVRTLTSQPPTLEELFLRHYAQDEPTGHAVPATS